MRLGLDEVAAMAQLRDDVVLGSAFEDALRRVTPRWEQPARDDELRGLGFDRCTAGDGRSFFFKLKQDAKPWDRPTVVLPATRRPLMDAELRRFGLSCCETSDGRTFFYAAGAKPLPWERPTVSVPATRRPATDEQLGTLGYSAPGAYTHSQLTAKTDG